MESREVKAETFADVFDALADTPEEAANLKVRADLLTALRDRVKAWGVVRRGCGRAAWHYAPTPQRPDARQAGSSSLLMRL